MKRVNWHNGADVSGVQNGYQYGLKTKRPSQAWMTHWNMEGLFLVIGMGELSLSGTLVYTRLLFNVVVPSYSNGCWDLSFDTL